MESLSLPGARERSITEHAARNQEPHRWQQQKRLGRSQLARSRQRLVRLRSEQQRRSRQRQRPPPRRQLPSGPRRRRLPRRKRELPRQQAKRQRPARPQQNGHPRKSLRQKRRPAPRRKQAPRSSIGGDRRQLRDQSPTDQCLCVLVCCLFRPDGLLRVSAVLSEAVSFLVGLPEKSRPQRAGQPEEKRAQIGLPCSRGGLPSLALRSRRVIISI